MMFAAEPIPVSACLLADHLDAILAVGEDLLKVRGVPPPPVEDPVEQILAARAAQRRAVERIRLLETAFLTRVVTARERAAELARADARFRMMARLFASGSTPLADAAAECADSTACDFESGDGITAYLRGRGALPDNVLALAETAEVSVDETFLLGRRAPLGAFMDLAARFLDELEEHFDLYGATGEAYEATIDESLGTVPPMPAGSEPRSGVAPKLESLIETTLQVMFEPVRPKNAKDTGWAPGSLLAALAQIDAENEAARKSSG